MPNVTFLEPGTDATQDPSLFTSTATAGTGTIASATDQAHTGPRSLKVINAAANDNAFAQANGVLADAGRAISFWVRFSSAAPSVASLFVEAESGVNSILGIALNTTGK